MTTTTSGGATSGGATSRSRLTRRPRAVPTPGLDVPPRRAAAARGDRAGGARRAPAGASSTTRAGRCWCSPARAPARPPRWSRRSSDRIEDGRRPEPGAGADVLPQGRRAAARPGHRPARPDDVHPAELDVPLVRLRPGPALRARRAVRRPAAAAERPRAGRGPAGAAHRQPRVGRAGPSSCARPSAPAASRARSTRCCPAPASAASTPTTCVALGRAEKVPEFEAAGLFLAQYLDVLGDQAAIDYPDLIARAVHRGQPAPRRAPRPVQPRLRRRVPGHRPQPGRAAAGARRRRPRPDRRRRPRPVDLRLPRRRGPRHPRLPDRVPDRRRRPGAGGRARHHPALRVPAAAGLAQHRRRPSASPAPSRADGVRRVPPARARRQRVRTRQRSRCSPSTPPAPRPSTSPTCCAAPTSRTASAGPRWRCWSAPAAASIPALRRSLGAAGVPVEVASDDTPLVREPAVLPLLGALAVVVDAGIDDPHHDDYVGADRVEALLTSPLGGLDATDVRSLTRALRARDRATPARELVRRAVLEPESLDGLDGEPARRATRLAGLLAAARAALADGGTAEEVLWALWDGSDWGRRLRQATAGRRAGRPPRPPRPRRDLRAVRDRRPRRGAEGPHQRPLVPGDPARPGDPRRHPRRPRRPRRRRTPAHRPPVQGPGVAARRRRPGPGGRLARPAPPRLRCCSADRIGRDGLLPPITTPRAARRGAPAVLRRRHPRPAAAGRHRGRSRPTTTASSPPASSHELGRGTSRCTASGARAGRCRWPGWSPSCAVPSPTPTSPSRCGAPPPAGCGCWPTTDVHGRPVAASADPATWWGLRAPTPLRATGPRRRTSRSRCRRARSRGCSTCPAQWFLQREAGGEVVSSTSQGFGKVVHAIAERIANGDLDVDADLMPLVDEVWGRMEFRTPWSAPASARRSPTR